MPAPQTTRDVLTPLQRRVWEAVVAGVLADGLPPTLAALIDSLGMNNKQSVAQVVYALGRKGFLDLNWLPAGHADAVRASAAANADRFRCPAANGGAP